jgi:hypothetical protein
MCSHMNRSSLKNNSSKFKTSSEHNIIHIHNSGLWTLTVVCEIVLTFNLRMRNVPQNIVSPIWTRLWIWIILWRLPIILEGTYATSPKLVEINQTGNITTRNRLYLEVGNTRASIGCAQISPRIQGCVRSGQMSLRQDTFNLKRRGLRPHF